jgi:UDP-glucose 4-epimerase
MRIAVTGGSGELGRSLVPYLSEQGHDVVSLDRTLPPPPAQRPARYTHSMVVDTRDFGEVVAALRGCDAVIHLAAHRSPLSAPDPVVYTDNTAGSYNVLSAATTLGIDRVCLASSINAIGGAFSRAPRYDYFPVDEAHPTYAEDPYSLSKWVGEQQADAFARRYETLRVASLRFHGLRPNFPDAQQLAGWMGPGTIRHLWAYTAIGEACRACLLAITADFTGHEVFYIVAPQTVVDVPSLELAQTYYPDTPLRGDLPGFRGFFDCSKAQRLLGWAHVDERHAH